MQALFDDLRFVRPDLARLLERSNRKYRPKTSFPTHIFSEQSSEEAIEEEILNLDRGVTFQQNPRGPAFEQREVLKILHRACARFMDFCYCYKFNICRENRKKESSSSPPHIRDSGTLMTAFKGTDSIIILNFLSVFVYRCDLE